MFQYGGNSNKGNTANLFFMNARLVASILKIHYLLVVLTWKLLVALNATHTFADIDLYKHRAAKAHRFDDDGDSDDDGDVDDDGDADDDGRC